MSAYEVGSAVKRARKTCRLSVLAASEAVGVSPSTVKRWENGSNLPHHLTLDAIFDQWGVASESPYRETIHSGAPTSSHRAWSIEAAEDRPILRLLRSKRRRNRLTLQDISEATGLSAPSIYRYESGQRIPSASDLHQVAFAVGCDREEIAVLERSLFTSADSRDQQPLIYHHFVKGHQASPQAYTFESADKLLRTLRHPSPSELIDLAGRITDGLLFMADFQSFIELWPRVKKRLESLEVPIQADFSAARTLAKVCLEQGRDKNHKEFQRHLATSIQLEEPNQQLRTGMLVIRMAIMLDDLPEARRQLEHQRKRYSELMREESIHTFEAYDCLIATKSGEPYRAMQMMDRLDTAAMDCIQRYTNSVLQLDAAREAGDDSVVRQMLTQCAQQEQEFGLGSPTADRIRSEVIGNHQAAV